MKVVLIGNVNNEPYRLAHEIALRGHSAQVVLTSPALLDDPDQLSSLAYYENSPVQVTRDLAVLTPWDWMRAPGALRRRLHALTREADVVVGNSVALSVLCLLGKPYAAFVTGSDVTVYARPGFAQEFRVRGRRTRWRERLRGRSPESVVSNFVARQQLGVAQATLIVTLPTGASVSLEDAFKELDVGGVPRFPWSPYTPSDEPPEDQQTRAAREDLRVLVGSRVTRQSTDMWERSDLDDKGSESIIAGWAQALAAGFRGKLVLFDKGPGVREAKAFLKSLGLDQSVTWIPQTDLPGFLDEIAASDVVVDSLGGAPPGRVTIDALAAGKPVITRISAEEQSSRFGTVFPQLFTAESAEQFRDALLWIQASGAHFACEPRAMTLVERYLSPHGNARPIVNELERVSGS